MTRQLTCQVEDRGPFFRYRLTKIQLNTHHAHPPPPHPHPTQKKTRKKNKKKKTIPIPWHALMYLWPGDGEMRYQSKIIIVFEMIMKIKWAPESLRQPNPSKIDMQKCSNLVNMNIHHYGYHYGYGSLNQMCRVANPWKLASVMNWKTFSIRAYIIQISVLSYAKTNTKVRTNFRILTII